MIDAWGGWPQFQKLLGACKAVGDRHGVGIAPVGIRYILDQVHWEDIVYCIRFVLCVCLKTVSCQRVEGLQLPVLQTWQAMLTHLRAVQYSAVECTTAENSTVLYSG